ncbi:MAG: RecJ, partial [uncultured Solirubrobacterales bacterium]
MARMSPSSIRWDCRPYSGAAASALEGELGVSSTVAAILARRGHDSPVEADRFLRAEERHDPFAFAGMRATCELLLSHVARGSRIVIHGDYDVDGVSSTAILVNALRRLGADPAWHLPSRFDGGYGLSVATVEELARAGTDLLIAVDCGITSAPEIDTARALGLDAVVVDHHRPAERLPDCPIVHPTVSGYPFADLCAAGVALKLAEALAATAGEDPSRAEEEDLDLVALATVADLVSMRGENRRLVRAGLRALARTGKPGLRALMAVSSLDPGRLDAGSVGFRLAPRLNAAGRLGRADGALELL